MRALRIVAGAVAALLLAVTALYVLGIGHVLQLLAADERAREQSPFH